MAEREKATVWKVVRRCFGSDRRFVSVAAAKVAQVHYGLGCSAWAPMFLANWGYGLCYFSTLEAAAMFAHPHGPEVCVVLCEAEGPIDPLPPRLTLGGISLGLLEKLPWSDSIYDWPPGTVMYEKVTVKEVV